MGSFSVKNASEKLSRLGSFNISTIDLPILQQENLCGPFLGICQSLTDTWMWKWGLRLRYYQKRNKWMGFLLQCTICDCFHCKDAKSMGSFYLSQVFSQLLHLVSAYRVPGNNQKTSSNLQPFPTYVRPRYWKKIKSVFGRSSASTSLSLASSRAPLLHISLSLSCRQKSDSWLKLAVSSSSLFMVEARYHLPLTPPPPKAPPSLGTPIIDAFLKEHKHDIFLYFFCRNRNLMVPSACNTKFLKIVFDSAEIFDF
jgi:hypothetical protein